MTTAPSDQQTMPLFRAPDAYLRTALTDLIDQYGPDAMMTELGVQANAGWIKGGTLSPGMSIHPAAHTRSRTGDPDTSRAAARSLDPAKLGPVYRELMNLLANTEAGLTHEQVWHNYRGPLCSMSGLRTRLAELVDVGLVKDSGRREKLRSGRQGIVWVIA
jgi:hypothetical protein